MADSELQQLSITDRNPVQETRYQQLLSQAGTPFTLDNGKASVAGFGTGGNMATVPQFNTAAGIKTAGTTTSNVALPTVPAFDEVAATNAAYNTPEITAAKSAITTREQALADATAEVNDNPFYSEATRVGKLAKLTDQANNDIKVQQDQLTMLNADAQVKLNAQKDQYNINSDAYKTNLSNFNNLVSQGGLDNASANDIANMSIQTGIPTSVIQSIQAVSIKKDNPTEKPTIVQSTDNEGNLTILAVDPTTGKIINQTQIAGAGKAKEASAADTKVTEDAQNKTNAAAAAKAGAQLKELIDHYGSVLSVEEIYAIYNSNSKTPAKESLDSVKEGRYANVANSGWY